MSTIPPLSNFPILRTAGRLARVRRLFWGLVATLSPVASGCVAGNDAEGRLSVASQAPDDGETWPANAPLEIRFDRYLATLPVRSPGIRLVSADTDVPLGLLYDPVERALLLQPEFELTPGVGYLLTVDAGAIRALDGTTLGETVEIGFVATPGGAQPPQPTVDFEADVRPIFERRCSCHGAPPLTWPELTPESLVDVASRANPALSLVAPGAPLRSQLVRKLLPGYPGVPGQPMPPEGPLSADALHTVLDWVRDL